MPQLRIGISGWRYPPWRNTFYPKGITQKRELEYASRQLNSIEINGSFYSLHSPSSWQRWFNETPDNFLFSIKASRYITHLKRLKDIEEPLANFFAQGLLALQQKLGPILWQFPPNFKFNPALLETFFQKLPRTHKQAAQLASTHSDRINGKTFFQVTTDRPLRHAIEIRHASFATPDYIALLRKHNIASVVAETAGKWPTIEDLTSDFLYLRLHGDEQLYTSGYSPKALDLWAKKIKSWSQGKEPKDAKTISPTPARKRTARDVFIYFDNDVKVRSPFDAIALAQRLQKQNSFLPPNLPTHPPENMPGEARTNWPLLNYKSLPK